MTPVTSVPFVLQEEQGFWSALKSATTGRTFVFFTTVRTH